MRSYLQDGRLKIDNNLAENAIRPIALSRKNFLFCGNHGKHSGVCAKTTFRGIVIFLSSHFSFISIQACVFGLHI
ncbi:transposase [Bacteroides fragilis]|uniref:Transposase IS66 central domain-containing protein n=1 Tax=Bacteroides fragilis TaxID=817 RepID=A0A396BXY5_BACFG|nr:IS66 family transposase [Bacteroides fragilis]QLK84935.1 hypothetical protein DBK98_023985 [Bacteroides sp. PHL 2737]MCE8673740.1 IS66 family transposase [Bacteroides fragilis]MCE8685547.1 IS66 family transposase [Bacteroides fragilis]MCE8693751.1 IS66 family transposase [Bacteroides fragilis]